MPDFDPLPPPVALRTFSYPLPYAYIRMSLAPRIVGGPYGLMLYLNHLENCLTFDTIINYSLLMSISSPV